jgi:hypothetical protein
MKRKSIIFFLQIKQLRNKKEQVQNILRQFLRQRI